MFSDYSCLRIILHSENEVKVPQLCLTLCDPTDYTVHGILQAKILECVAFPFSRWSSQPRDRTQVPHIGGRFFTSWATREAQEYWRGKPKNTGVGSLSLLQWDFPNPGIELGSPALQADSLPAEPPGSTRILEWVAYPFSNGIFPTQESNWGLLHCRWILYQLSY